MKEKINIQKIPAFIIAIVMLSFFLMVCIPWMEKQLIPSEMKMIMEEKEINPAHLFYSESAVSGEAIFDLQKDLIRQNE